MKMKRIIAIGVYWIIALLLIAVVVASCGYNYNAVECLYISILFLPGALAVKFFFPKVSFYDKKKRIMTLVFLTIGVILMEILLIILAHFFIILSRGLIQPFFEECIEQPSILTNPVFIAIIISSLSVGNYFYEQWIDKRYPASKRSITFLSERKQVTLNYDEILYIESNNTVTIVVATDGRSFVNKTLISQWENILGNRFIRIHRSYLVNRTAVSKFSADYVRVGEKELPISRKYKEVVQHILNDLNVNC